MKEKTFEENVKNLEIRDKEGNLRLKQVPLFEEQFPSLKGKLGTFHEESHHPNGAHGYIEWFDPLGELIHIDQMIENCLDKQKVRDAIKKLREDTKDNFQMMTSDAGARIKIVQLNNALCYIEEIEKELGL